MSNLNLVFRHAPWIRIERKGERVLCSYSERQGQPRSELRATSYELIYEPEVGVHIAVPIFEKLRSVFPMNVPHSRKTFSLGQSPLTMARQFGTEILKCFSTKK